MSAQRIPPLLLLRSSFVVVNSLRNMGQKLVLRPLRTNAIAKLIVVDLLDWLIDFIGSN